MEGKMPYIPRSVAFDEGSQLLLDHGLVRVHSGKVRDTFVNPNRPDVLLVYTTNRLSIFDFVLGTTVPFKGEVLNALSVFFLKKVLASFPNHLLAVGEDINGFLPRKLRHVDHLKKNVLVVRKLKMIPVEFIVRGYLTGSGLLSYQESGSVCGISLPSGLVDGSKIYSPIFTPTTKEDVGHDEPMSSSVVKSRYPVASNAAVAVYRTVCDFLSKRGIILADTKLEFGFNDNNGTILGDEVCTPDSSRFWLSSDWEKSPGKSPVGYDKQIVREWGKGIGINKMSPNSPDDAYSVGNIPVPSSVVAQTSSTYLQILRMITDCTVDEFWSQYF